MTAQCDRQGDKFYCRPITNVVTVPTLNALADKGYIEKSKRCSYKWWLTDLGHLERNELLQAAISLL